MPTLAVLAGVLGASLTWPAMNGGGGSKAWIGVLAVLCAPAGCSTYAVSRYAVSATNVAALRTLRGQPINVGAFSAAEDVFAIDCRAVGPIKTPDAESFSQYVRAALIAELEMAEVYSVAAPITLTGTLDQIDFSSVSGQWKIGLTVLSSNGKRLHVDETYGFTSSYFGETACNQTAQAFMPGVQDLIAKLVRDPAFRSLVASPQGTLPPAS